MPGRNCMAHTHFQFRCKLLHESRKSSAHLQAPVLLQAVAELMQVSSNKSPWGLPTGACWFERYETHSWRRHSWRGHARTELQHSRRLKWHSEVATDRARITSCHLQAARGWVVV